MVGPTDITPRRAPGDRVLRKYARCSRPRNTEPRGLTRPAPSSNPAGHARTRSGELVGGLYRVARSRPAGSDGPRPPPAAEGPETVFRLCSGVGSLVRSFGPDVFWFGRFVRGFESGIPNREKGIEEFERASAEGTGRSVWDVLDSIS